MHTDAARYPFRSWPHRAWARYWERVVPIPCIRVYPWFNALFRPLRMLFVQVPMLLDQHLVEREPRRRDLALLRGVDDRAARLAEVRAVVELAAPQVRPEFHHRFADLVLGEVEQPERLEARGIDD